MSERPILFSGPMIRALLDGRKTQTRRVVKAVANYVQREAWEMRSTPDGFKKALVGAAEPFPSVVRCPYGQPGDRLWVRETWTAPQSAIAVRDQGGVLYRAEPMWDGMEVFDWNWRPSIHMPRWASRLTLEVTDVRVERVQEISEEDAVAEGCAESTTVDHSLEGYGIGDGLTIGPVTMWTSASGNYEALWDSLNAKRGHGWDQNPWVWALTFRRLP